mgnify:CR=1 FL=1
MLFDFTFGNNQNIIFKKSLDYVIYIFKLHTQNIYFLDDTGNMKAMNKEPTIMDCRGRGTTDILKTLFY